MIFWCVFSWLFVTWRKISIESGKSRHQFLAHENLGGQKTAQYVLSIFPKSAKNHQKCHFLSIRKHEKRTFCHFLTHFGHMTVFTKPKSTHVNFMMEKVAKNVILLFLKFLSSNRKEYFCRDIRNGHFSPFLTLFHIFRNLKVFVTFAQV